VNNTGTKKGRITK